jgi:hypothetical protein
MAEKKTIELEVKTDSVKNLKTQLREAQQEVQVLAEKFGATSREATEAAKKAAKLKDAIGDAKALTDAFNPDAKFNALSGALSGVAGGFSAVQGAMGLFGSESENVQKALLKVQSAMALSQGINSIMGAKDAFTNLAAVIGKTTIGQRLLTAAQVVGAATMRVLNTVMKANPIFLIIAGILAAVAAFKYFSSSTETATEKNDKLNASLERQEKQLQRNNDALKKNGENRLKILQAQGASEEEIHDQTLDNLENEEVARLKNLEFIKQKIKEKRAILKQAYEDEDEELIKSTAKEINDARGKYFELIRLKRDNTTNIIVEEESYAKKLRDKKAESDKKDAEEENKAAEERRKRANERREKEKQKQKEYDEAVIKARKDLDEEIKKIAEEQQEKQKKDQEDRIKAAKKAEEDIYNNAKGFLQAAVTDDENNLQAKKDLLEVEKEILLQNKELTEGEIAAIEAKYRKDREQLDADDLVKRQNAQQQKLRMAVDALGILQDATSLFTAKNEKDARRQFKINKALSLSSAVVNTALAVTAALTAGGNPLKLATGAQFVEAGIAAASGAVSIAKISATQFTGGGSSSGSGGTNSSTPSTPSTSSGVIAPKFNVVGSSANQLNTLQQQPIQAYVVSGDVTSAQSLDRNRIKNATL